MDRDNSSERFVLIESLYQQAADLAPEKRADFLARCCEDAGIRQEVAALLRHHDSSDGGFLAEPASDLSQLTELARTPERIGRYEIVRQLGEGGMGVVYEAQQDNPRRNVAIKLIRPGVSSAQALRRFEHEAAVLARLQHPGIAHVYEAGIADVVSPGGEATARPFFAMELVDGVSLREYVAASKPDTRGRLELFATICDAVEHAHQKGVIHRDLKPGNILVTADGRPKVLDFGVARITDADVQMTTMHTRAAQVVGTLPYMSPEQVEGRVEELDTRSDVYTLGVILYELLTDRLPHDLSTLSIAQAARVICEHAPIPLASCDRAYRGDLATIVGKALEKDASRRYASVSELAADIRRFLNREPIAARPASTVYQIRKFTQRNKALVGGIAATFVALSLAVVGTSYGMLQADRQRDEASHQRDEAARQRDNAELEAQIVDAVNNFLTKDVLESADPDNEPDRDIKLSVVLDRAAEKIEGRFKDAPLVEAEIRRTIGKAYRHLGRLDLAEQHLNAALDLFRAQRGEEDEDTLLCRMELAAILMDRQENDRAEQEFLDLLAVQRRVLGDEHEQTIASLHNLGTIYVQEGRFDKAEPILLETLELRERLLGEEDTHTAITMSNLGVLYTYTNRPQKALEILKRAVEIHKRVSGPEHPDTLEAMANLAATYAALGRNEDAAALLEQVLAANRRVFGPENSGTLTVATNLAAVYGRLGRSEEREKLLRDTLEVQRRVLGETHFGTLVTRLNLAKVGFDKGEFEQAQAEYDEIARMFKEHYPAHFLGGVARSMDGQCLMKLGRMEEAEQSLLEAHRILLQSVGPDNKNTQHAADVLADFYEQWDKPDQAEKWREPAAAAAEESAAGG